MMSTKIGLVRQNKPPFSIPFIQMNLPISGTVYFALNIAPYERGMTF
jgi:hypothetical protein